MGKIRTKIIGSEEVEKEQKEKAQARREAKKLLKDKKEVVGTADMPSVQKKSAAKKDEVEETVEVEEVKKDKKPAVAKAMAGEEKSSAKPKKTHGKKYIASKKLVNEKKMYALKDAVALIKKMKYASFDESVELHLNVYENNLKGEVSLPAGTGKKIRVAIVDDDVVAKIEKGIIDFDVLIAAPQMMPKLIKFAKVLGPKGLMPSPKAGTVTDKPEEVVKKFTGGNVRYKTEAKFPIIHQTVGKMSFKDEDLINNVSALLKAVAKKNIASAYLTSSMTPSVQIVVE